MIAKNDPNLVEYLEYIKADYAKWKSDSPYRDEFIANFNASLTVEYGTKYIKVVADRAAHSFICLQDMGKFTKGDILKPASWAAPAKNFTRGNIMSRDFGQIRWTGAQ